LNGETNGGGKDDALSALEAAPDALGTAEPSGDGAPVSAAAEPGPGEGMIDAEGRPLGADRGDDSGETEVEDGAAAPPLVAVLEAVLFAAAEPVPLGRLSRLLAQWPRAAVVEGLGTLEAALAGGERGVRLVETASGFQLRSASECAPWIRRFFAEKPPRLSRPLLETVAIIAYRQPVTRGEIESIRGVNCDAVLGALVTRGLAHIVGRRQSPGRPVEYGTTSEFLDLFSLRDLSELPPLPDPAALASLIVDDDGDLEAGSDDAAGAEQEHAESASAGTAGGGEAAEDPEPGGDRLAADGGGSDPGGPGAGEREGHPRARDEG